MIFLVDAGKSGDSMELRPFPLKMILKKLQLSLLWAFCMASLLCSPAYGQGFTFKNYTQAQGLKNLNVDCMLQDQQGFLWLGTDHGLFRYDGARFREYGAADGLSSLYILALTEDASHHLWVGTSSGLFYLQGDRFSAVLYQGAPLAMNVDSSLAATADGRILAVSRYRLLEVVPDSSSVKLESTWLVRQLAIPDAGAAYQGQTIVNSVHVDRDQNVWFNCGKGICELSGTHFTFWGTAQGVPDDDWSAIFSARDQSIWVRSANQVIRMRPGERAFTNLTDGYAAKFSNNYYISFVEDKFGNVLTPTAEGLAIWTQNAWQFYGPQQGLSTYPVTSLLAARDGIIWLGVGGHGLAKWVGYGEWQQWTTAQGLQSPIVWGILKDNAGRIWVAQDGGLSVLPPGGKNFDTVTAHMGDHAKAMLGITQDLQGNIWACSGSGVLIRVDANTLQPRRWLPDVPGAHQIFADSQDRLWISTEQGLYEIDNARTSTTAHKIDFPGRAAGDIYRVAEDHHGVIWAAGENGLFYLGNTTWNRVDLQNAQLQGQISDVDVAPDNSLWVVNDFSKVVHLHLVNDAVASFESFTTPYLSSSEALFARLDQRGWVWVGHDNGVDVYDGKVWLHYGREDGLLWNDVDGRAFFADPDGSVWIGTSEGLSHFLRPQDPLQTTPLALHVESARYGNLDLLTQKNNRIRWSNASLSIRVSPLEYRHESDISFRYRLLGSDPDWSNTSNSLMRYSPLAPGKYTFQAIAVDDAWHRQSGIQSLSFEILPPWWQSLWLRVLAVVAVIAFLFWLWSIRVVRLIKRQRKLELLVDERTRELQQEKKELIEVREALRHEATHDALTGLWNRKAILELLERELDRAYREQSSLAVVLIDIDYFKNINDQHGHLVGDAVLKECGIRLHSSVRTYDSAGRYGGEEFLVLLPNLERATGEHRLESLSHALKIKSYYVNSIRLKLTCSMGVAWIHQGLPVVSTHHMIEMADAALYRAKAAGRDRIEHAG